jgi:hypothetical protein
MAVETLLIETKLYPPRRRADLLVRSRLLEFLHEHITNKLLLLVAPAGYGKTTLLVDYIHDLDIPVCWFSLDESDWRASAAVSPNLIPICQPGAGQPGMRLDWIGWPRRSSTKCNAASLTFS